MSKASKSVNRPPTPEPEEKRELTLEESIQLRLVQSGEKERLTQLLRDRLEECGWRDNMEAYAQEVMLGSEKRLTVDELVAAIKPLGRKNVPDHIKAELISKLRDQIVTYRAD